MEEQCSAGVAAGIQATTWKTLADSRRADAPRVAVRIPKSLDSFSTQFKTLAEERVCVRASERTGAADQRSPPPPPFLLTSAAALAHKSAKLPNKINKKITAAAKESFMWEQLF